MDILLASGSTALLFTAAIWLLKNLIVTRLTRSVESEFSKILESYRSELRVSEEKFKYELGAKERELAALRSGAISALASRQASLDARRLQAADDVWNCVVGLSPLRFVSSIMSRIKFEEAAEAAVHDPKVRLLVSFLDKHFDAKNLEGQLPASRARPFVSPMLWASFSAYSTILYQALMRANAIKGGIGARDFMDNEKVSKLLKSVLPHYAKLIDDHGAAAYHHLLEDLEGQIIKEIHLSISGVEADAESIKRAADVLRQANEIALSSELAEKER